MEQEQKEQVAEVTETSTGAQQTLMSDSELGIIREDFYNVALNLFEAAKRLKPYDILFTDVLLGQAQYFLNLSDNPDLLYSVCEMNQQTRLKNIGSNIPVEVQSKIEQYADTIKAKLAELKKEKDASNEG